MILLDVPEGEVVRLAGSPLMARRIGPLQNGQVPVRVWRARDTDPDHRTEVNFNWPATTTVERAEEAAR
jgi:hypothetical protein